MHRRQACLLPLVLSGPARGDERAPLRIGWSDYPPFQYKGAADQPQGLDVELLELLARAAGERLKWHHRPWARQTADVAQGELDLMPAATLTPERRVVGDFTQPYRNERVALIGLAGGGPAPRRLAELKARAVRVGVIRGVAFPEAVRRELEEPGMAGLLLPLHANDLTLSALRARRVDYVIDDPVTLLHRAGQEPGEAVEVVLELAVSPVHVYVSRRTLERRPDLMARLNAGLQRARQQPEWGRVLSRYPGY